MGLRSAIANLLAPVPVEELRWSPDGTFTYNGNTYYYPTPTQTLVGNSESVGQGYVNFATGGYAGNSVVYTCMNARAALFKQARFMYRQLRSGTPGEMFSTSDLEILRTPWPNGTTSDLLARMIQDVDLGGNAFILRRGTRLVRLRPDWVTIMHGSYADPTMSMWDPEAELLGYVYRPGGPGSGRIVTYEPRAVAHFAPSPDPLAPARGLSWLSSLIREIDGDSAAMDHRLAYFRNGATPNMVITNVPGATKVEYDEWVKRFSAKHDGVSNAYKTLYFSGAADAKVIGNDLAQADFKVTTGLGETRIAAAAGVPPIVAGLSEGLQGSSLNAGNFAAAMRRFADLTGRSLWADVSGALATIVTRKPGAELWYDDRYIPALKDDIKDAAEVQQLQAQAIRQYVDAGFDPATVVDAVNAGDLKRLKHLGLYSVQLQPPMPEAPAEPDPTPDPGVPAEPEPTRSELIEWLIARPQPAPQVTIEEGAVTLVQKVPMRSVIERDADGRITGSHEEPIDAD